MIQKNQLAFDSSIYSNPDPDKPTQTGNAPRPGNPKPSRKNKPDSPASSQPYLPGLSRRGRPRSKNPIPATVRASESRQRRIAAGMKRVELLLSPQAAADLALLTEHYHLPRAELLARLITKEAGRIRRITITNKATG